MDFLAARELVSAAYHLRIGMEALAKCLVTAACIRSGDLHSNYATRYGLPQATQILKSLGIELPEEERD